MLFPDDEIRFEKVALFLHAVVKLQLALALPLRLGAVFCQKPSKFDLEPYLPTGDLLVGDHLKCRLKTAPIEEFME
ncbi:hypothetical protein D3C77_600720 [compost metagenome]